MDTKEQIKRDISIMEVASLYTELKPAGKYYKGLCPFHTEKTPSFFIMPDKDTFSCYGCNKFGDIFTLIQEQENMGFSEAIDFLIDKFNLNIEKNKYQKSSSKDLLIKTNEIALAFFRENLLDSPEGKEAFAYLKNRKINRDTIDFFSLGFTHDKWDGLYQHLKNNSASIEKAIELGLLISNKNKIYDRFRGRIIFPIFSETGKILAFGGRTIYDSPSKYINSPDSPLYKKNRNLYGLYQTKQFIREKKAVVLVEGNIDLISLFQHGIKNVVASLGTALGEQQVYLLKRFAENITLFYDSDRAGITAAIRGTEKMLEQNVIPKVIAFEEAMDPDDFIRNRGLKAFNQELKEAKDGIKFIIEQLSQEYDLNLPEKKSQAIHKVKEIIDKISDSIIRDDYMEIVADYFRVSKELLKSNRPGNLATEIRRSEILLSPAEQIFLESIISMPELIKDVKGLFNQEILSVLKSKNIIQLIFKHFDTSTNKLADLNTMTEEMSPEEQILFRQLFEKQEDLDMDRIEMEARIESCFYKFQDILIKLKTKEIDKQLKIAERNKNKETIINLMTQKFNFIKKKHTRAEEE